MGVSRQEYWNGLLCPPPGDLSDPGTEHQVSHIAGRFFTFEPWGKPIIKADKYRAKHPVTEFWIKPLQEILLNFYTGHSLHFSMCWHVVGLKSSPFRFLWNLEITIPCDLAIPLLGIYPEKSIIEKDACTPVFITALFKMARTWTQPRFCDRWMDEDVVHISDIYTHIWLAIIKEKVLSQLNSGWWT